MSDLFTQQSTMPELFKTGEDIAEELKAQTVEPNTATDLLLNGDSKPNRFSRQCAENEEPDADLTENLLHDEKSNKNTITGTNTPRSSRASAYYDLLRSQHKNGHYKAPAYRVVDTAAVNGVFAFLIAGGLLFTAHGVTPEFLLNLLFYIIITPVISLTLTRIMYMSENKMVVADALARIDSVLEAAPMQVQAVPQHPKDSSVTLQDVHFSYDGKTDVIKGVSLEIQPGRTVAFVGPSGGGKSTLANLVCRFFDVQSGSVRVGGADVRDIPKEELMDTISFVFQNSRLLKGSILDNVRLGRPQATEAEVLAALKAAQCMDIIEKFPAGIHTVIGTKGVYLSGGEQQRIAIARAMLKNVPILILDEATAFADPDNEAKVQAAFAQLAKGKTVLMIAHRLSTVANADCIYVVQDGQIVESGTKDELCAQNGLFARMWQEYQASVQWKVAKEG